MLLWLAVGGCASVPAGSKFDRKAETGWEPEQRVVFLLESYYADGGQEIAAAKSSSIENCIQAGMKSVDRSFQIVRSADALKTVYPGKDAPRSPEEILADLESDGHAALWGSLGVRYVVIVNVNVWDTSSKLEGWGAGKLGFGGTSKWTETTDMNATVVDVSNVRLSGTVYAKASGEEGAGLYMILIIPIPHGYGAATESSACRELGRSLAQFLTGTTK